MKVVDCYPYRKTLKQCEQYTKLKLIKFENETKNDNFVENFYSNEDPMYSTFHHLYDFEDLTGYSYQPVLVDTIVQIQSINDVNLNREYMDATIAISMKWEDSRLQWDSSKFGNVTKIRVRKEEVWIPDLTIVNRIHDFSPQDEKHPKCEF